jgi:hypothetical protein
MLKTTQLKIPRGKPRGIFTGRTKKAISSSLAKPAASGGECARYRGSGRTRSLSPTATPKVNMGEDHDCKCDDLRQKLVTPYVGSP